MALTAEQVISTVLMRLGNRQGNAALAAQAVLEYDLLMQELYALPKLPRMLAEYSAEQPSYIKPFSAGSPMTFSGEETQELGNTYIMCRLAEAQNDIQPVKLIAVAGDYVNEPLTPISEDDWDVLRAEDSESNSTGQPKYYLVRTTWVFGQLLYGSPKYAGTVPVVTLYPYIADKDYIVGYSGYYANNNAWLYGAQNLVIAGLGKRMAPYVRDANMLQLFETQFQRELQKLYDRDTAIEEDHKPGLRGDLKDR